ncbi:MAG: uracil-DNA glycosylase [Candidatus Harrisonbacteria bacterium CG10_big_fil_rev_8_21_14_0_10_44_23]|uniref:Uracil-DNA glycosylase n=1 Tax=Candidatus Harrisonbacteria bacterium CG10_big_fil_rev_8_21_14_0_10_44_23 TaxID=1974585 RepID=A0A2H0UPM1_9BACT|nr:MAG: uracil-DNA glycosylase [Candidatus Harrisonbacteria bacterium CG10_big_fil_rev_8_21_14_0_10_44_23]
MKVKIHPSWEEKLGEEFQKPYFKDLVEFVKGEYGAKTVYPPPTSIFRAFDLCPFDGVKVVILGQDPYHGPNQANGLCFAVHEGVANPPSLNNIFKEIEADLGKRPKSGDLEKWAKQGVLLLNATLTVEAGQAGSHQRKGWEQFTDAVVKKLSDERAGLVFMLWGRYAQERGRVVDFLKHQVLTAAHPSPLSAHSGFFGCKHFSQANNYLESRGEEPIDWL